MCGLFLQILMLVSGLYALIAAMVKITSNLTLEGWRARVAGLILLSPFPASLALGLLLGILISMGVLPESVEPYAPVLEMALLLGALVGAVIFGLAARPAQPLAHKEE